MPAHLGPTGDGHHDQHRHGRRYLHELADDPTDREQLPGHLDRGDQAMLLGQRYGGLAEYPVDPDPGEQARDQEEDARPTASRLVLYRTANTNQ